MLCEQNTIPTLWFDILERERERGLICVDTIGWDQCCTGMAKLRV